jgi:dihydrolipoyl dehydrogenase
VSTVTDVRVPDIGEFTDVPVIEIHVAIGDIVAPEDPLVTLESDKATMDVPAPAAGTIKQLSVKLGDRVSEGSVLLTLEGERDGAGVPSDISTAGAATAARSDTSTPGAATATAAPSSSAPEFGASDGAGPDAGDHDAQVLVIGSGPGGYTAAFRAADLGLKTVLVERYESLGGVCLNVGCIPSKSLLHAARVVTEAEEMAANGISFGEPRVDVNALLSWKQSVVEKLTGGLAVLAKQRRVEVIHGTARFSGPNAVTVADRTVTFDNCIIAAGSEAATLPFLPDDPRVIHSTGALSPDKIPERLLVIGGGIIGLEMATVYDALGSSVTVVELMDQLIPECDADLVRPLHKRISERYAEVLLETSVTAVSAEQDGLKVIFSDERSEVFDLILVAVGHKPNGAAVGADAAGVTVNERGFIPVDRQMRTNVPWIYAIGDVVGLPMLAHKAFREGRTAAEAIAGVPGAEFDARTVPAVAYTDPEVAWMGLTEREAREQGVEVEKTVIPWAASGRALSLARPDGLTKLLFEPGSRRLLGAGIVGVNAGELIAETVHALEMGATAEDIAMTIHPHPTLTETIMLAAEMAEGTITDLMPRRPRAGAGSIRG